MEKFRSSHQRFSASAWRNSVRNSSGVKSHGWLEGMMPSSQSTWLGVERLGELAGGHIPRTLTKADFLCEVGHVGWLLSLL